MLHDNQSSQMIHIQKHVAHVAFGSEGQTYKMSFNVCTAESTQLVSCTRCGTGTLFGLLSYYNPSDQQQYLHLQSVIAEVSPSSCWSDWMAESESFSVWTI